MQHEKCGHGQHIVLRRRADAKDDAGDDGAAPRVPKAQPRPDERGVGGGDADVETGDVHVPEHVRHRDEQQHSDDGAAAGQQRARQQPHEQRRQTRHDPRRQPQRLVPGDVEAERVLEGQRRGEAALQQERVLGVVRQVLVDARRRQRRRRFGHERAPPVRVQLARLEVVALVAREAERLRRHTDESGDDDDDPDGDPAIDARTDKRCR
jgi:hypothetical protein